MNEYKYNGRVNDKLLDAVRNLGNKSIEQLKLLGIKVVFEADNGIRILELSVDGIVDKDTDWDFTQADESTDQKTYRVYNVPEYVSNKQLIESTNFRVFNEMHYGLIELLAKETKLTSTHDAYRSDKATCMCDNINTGDYQGIILDKQGKLVVNHLGLNESAEESLTELRRPIIKHIIKHGYHKNLKSVRGCVTKGHNGSYLNSIFTFINTKNICSGKYQLAQLGSESITSYVLFDISDNKCIACGNGVPFKTWCKIEDKHTGELMTRVTIAIADDGVVAFNNVEGCYYKVKTETKHYTHREKEILLTEMKNCMVEGLINENKKLKLEQRYIGYTENEVRWFISESTEKLKQFGIDVKHAGKTRIIKAIENTFFGYHMDELTIDGYRRNIQGDSIDYVFILDGLSNDTPNKKALEEITYGYYVEHPYGMIELVHKDTTNVDDINYYRSVIIDKDGKVIFENISSMKTVQPGLSMYDSMVHKDSLAFDREMIDIASILMEEIIRQGFREEENHKSEYVKGSRYASAYSIMEMNVYNKGKYRLITDDFLTGGTCSLVMFNRETGELVAVGKGTFTDKIYRDIWAAVVEDGIIAWNTVTGEIFKKTMEVPKVVWGESWEDHSRAKVITKEIKEEIVSSIFNEEVYREV